MTTQENTPATELETLKKQCQSYLNNWKRAEADFINYKKEESKRLGELIKFANVKMILEILDVMDDLTLAANEMQNPGLNQICMKFEDLLLKYGVKKITVGDTFDPMLHEAVSSEPGGTLLKEIRAGYTMHRQVIRPARIKIVK